MKTIKPLTTMVLLSSILLGSCDYSPKKYDVAESVYELKETRQYIVSGTPDRLNGERFYMHMACGNSDVLVELRNTRNFLTSYSTVEAKEELRKEILDGDDQEVIVEGQFIDGILRADGITVNEKKYGFYEW